MLPSVEQEVAVPDAGSHTFTHPGNNAAGDSEADVPDVPSLLPSTPPPLPSRLSPAQSAEVAELLDYVQAVLREATSGMQMRPGHDRVEIDFLHWQVLLDLQARLANLLRRIGEPA